MSETVAAVSTPNGEGGIGLIRISGDKAVAIADRVFTSVSGRRIADISGYQALYGYAHDGDGKIDEVVALRFCAPKSYTGEDVVEITCHGGRYVTKRVLRAVFSAGALPAGPGEFTKRAFLNGKIDLSRAESVANIISSSGENALKAALKGHDGAIYNKISEIKNSLVLTASRIAVFSDYPDETPDFSGINKIENELNSALDQLNKLSSDYDAGKVYKDGIDTVIIGKPNVGKSTLMNLLSGSDRSIVTEIAGTTRDIIEETVQLGEIKLCLADTAGLHNTDDLVEAIGVSRSKSRVDTADLVLAVFDASNKLDDSDRDVIELCKNKRAIIVLNKTDLSCKTDEGAFFGSGLPVISISAKTSHGIDELTKTVNELFGLSRLDENSIILASERQYFCVQNALESVASAIKGLKSGVTLDAVGVMIDDALYSLTELTGETVTEEVTNEIFKNFCVGK